MSDYSRPATWAEVEAERALADDLAIGVDYLYEHGDARLLDAALARYRAARR